MPKERINHFAEQITLPEVEPVHHNCAPGGCTGTCDVVAETWPTVYVRWGAGGHDKLDISNVQIVLAEHEKPLWKDWLETDPWGQETAFPAPPVKREVYSAVLTRSEINKLIKVLRRARDQAYGVDE